MKKNMGLADRMIRVVLSGILAALYFSNTVTGTLGIVAIVAAGILLITAFISFCPLYTLLGIKTCSGSSNA